MPKVPIVNNRKEFRYVCNSVIENSQEGEELDHRKKLKTYIIESNIEKINSESLKGFFSIKDTKDSSLKILSAKLNGKETLNFYLDVEDKRFWKLYSLYDSGLTEQFIKKLVEQNNSKLDYLWMCSTLLEKYMRYWRNTGFGVKFKIKFLTKENEEEIKDVSMRFWGGNTQEVINNLRESTLLKKGINLSAVGLNHEVEGGYTKENITSLGRFTVMRGNSIDSHFNLLQKIKNDYSKIINIIESKYRMGYEEKENKLKLSGSPLYIDFSNPLEDVGKFVDIMVSSINPFRLSGVKRMVDNNFVRVFGIDLHTNDLINMEITPNWMAIYLKSNSCGNVITRLVTNIQTHLTPQIKLIGEDNEHII